MGPREGESERDKQKRVRREWGGVGECGKGGWAREWSGKRDPGERERRGRGERATDADSDRAEGVGGRFNRSS